MSSSSNIPESLIDDSVGHYFSCQPSAELIQAVSKHCTLILAISIPGICESSGNTDPLTGRAEFVLTPKGTQLHNKITSFFTYLNSYAPIIGTELLHIYYLVEQLMKVEDWVCNHGKPSMVSEENLGTVLLCASVIALKMLQDKPIKNKYFAEIFHIDCNVLSRSELSFLNKIEHRCWMNEEQFRLLTTYFISVLTLQRKVQQTPQPHSQALSSQSPPDHSHQPQGDIHASTDHSAIHSDVSTVPPNPSSPTSRTLSKPIFTSSQPDPRKRAPANSTPQITTLAAPQYVPG